MSPNPLPPWHRPLPRWGLLALLLAVLPACEEEEGPDPDTRGVMLIGNTRGHSVGVFDEETGDCLSTLVPAGSGGLVAPDAMVFGPDGHLYVASGDTPESSAVLRFDPSSGAFLGDSANGIRRHDVATRRLEATLATNYLGAAVRNAVGGLAFGAEDRLHTVGLDTEPQSGFPGVILRFNGQDNQPLPARGRSGARLVDPTHQLLRPIGVLYQRRPDA
jgi:hypothetical protein